MTDATIPGLVERFKGVPGVVSLAAGLPPAEAFPLVRLQAECSSGEVLQLGADGQQVTLAQQYLFNPQGFPPLVHWLRTLSDACHPAAPGAPARDLAITSGAINAISAIIALLTDPGDSLLVDEFSYTHALECVFLPKGLHLIKVKGDEQGMDARDLEQQVLAAEGRGLRRPRMVYLIPTGHNPTGVIMTPQRKRDIYEVACRQDLLLLEDDAYYFLHYPHLMRQQQQEPQQGAVVADAGEAGDHHLPAAVAPAPAPPGAADGPPELPAELRGLPPSLLSMDTCGRVVRVDTLSKVLGPGYRLGWASGPVPLLAKISQWTLATSVGPCSVSQVLVSQMLSKWGLEGFGAHVARLQRLYAHHSAAAHAAAQQQLTGLAEWQPAEAGMFMWFKLSGVADVGPVVLEELVKQRVVVVPGSMFGADFEAGEEGGGGGVVGAVRRQRMGAGGACPYFRLSFAASSPEQLQEGFTRLRAAVLQAQERQRQEAGRRAA